MFSWLKNTLARKFPQRMFRAMHVPLCIKGRYDAAATTVEIFTPGAPAAPSPTPGIPGQTTFSDVAASFSGWAENTMGSLASAISPGALNAGQSPGGFLDLSGADHVTGEIFSALAEASTSGGGGGGGCACAGCACACACAGGGR
jgi:hypothetical protein